MKAVKIYKAKTFMAIKTKKRIKNNEISDILAGLCPTYIPNITYFLSDWIKEDPEFLCDAVKVYWFLSKYEVVRGIFIWKQKN